MAEFIVLTTADLQRAGVDSVTLLDRDLNCVLRLLTGHPLTTVTTPYADVRDLTETISLISRVSREVDAGLTQDNLKRAIDVTR